MSRATPPADGAPVDEVKFRWSSGKLVPASVSEFASVEPHSAVAAEDLAAENLSERIHALRRRHEVKYHEHPQ